MTAPLWLDVLDEIVRVSGAHGRGDLIQRLRRRRAQLLDPRLRVLVLGEPKQGKSQLVNALLNASVCPVGEGVSTTIPTVVAHAAAPTAALVWSPLPSHPEPTQRRSADERRSPDGRSAQRRGPDGRSAQRRTPEDRLGTSRAAAPVAAQAAGPARRVTVPIEQVTARISGRGAGIADVVAAAEATGTTTGAGRTTGIGDTSGRRPGGAEHAEIGIPRELLASGVVLIDTPGAGGTDPGREISPAAIPGHADLVLLVSDVTRELSVTELNLLLHIAGSQANLVIVQSKIDMVPHWRTVVERNRQHLADAGVPATLIPVSATLRLQAARSNDKELNAESHFPELINRLKRDQAGKSENLARAAVALSARTVIEQLAAPLRAELAVSTAVESSGPISKLHAAQREVDELRRCSVRWQNTLNDEMADLMSDVEYDLRDRTRQILRKVDEAFDKADPLTGWDTFQDWLTENLTDAAEANYAWLAERCGWITQRVASRFDRYDFDALPSWSVRVPENLADRIQVMDQPSVERFTRTQKLVTGLRGSYGGVLMFGLATTLAGMPLINPISLGAGALFGGKSVRDEGKSLLKRRQAAVKTATQRHVDDFFLRLSKDCKDTARQVQRMLRDHFTGLTEELQEGIVRSFRSAKQAAEADAAERDQRHRRIALEMKRLADLYEQSQALVGAQSVAAGPTGLEPGP
ncbi:dynamin family protein [Plantactinospora soyae]|uniref:GTPase Era involved in 16S rRNA processing n=1 Tax=Plantactinospora soyae TaxID=1544732 RepID=A0A927M5S3_9ACTN|nr:dynamin family protein [Plantactinospora soyae]MBE1487286.1 GTPase Era involved in 16S rRNA processing [Plantactinospora soyae]